MIKILYYTLLLGITPALVYAEESKTNPELSIPVQEKNSDQDYVPLSEIKDLIPVVNLPEVSFQMGLDYSKGNYSDPDTTEVFYIPFTFNYKKGPWGFRATVGYSSLLGQATVIPGTGFALFSDLAFRPENPTSNKGIGDLYLSGSYAIESLKTDEIFIDLTTRIKLPTGNKEKGLSTGKADISFQFDIAKFYGNFLPFATIGYRHVGKTDRYNLQDTWFASLGISYYASQNLTLGLSFDFRKSITIDHENPKEIQAFADYILSEKWSVYLYGLAGLSKGSPDGGMGFHLKYTY